MFYGKDVCEYNKYGYRDGSKLQGNLSVETLTLDSTSGSSVSFFKIAIGRTHTNNIFHSGGSSGIIGLQSGPMSLKTKFVDWL